MSVGLTDVSVAVVPHPVGKPMALCCMLRCMKHSRWQYTLVQTESLLLVTLGGVGALAPFAVI